MSRASNSAAATTAAAATAQQQQQQQQQEGELRFLQAELQRQGRQLQEQREALAAAAAGAAEVQERLNMQAFRYELLLDLVGVVGGWVGTRRGGGEGRAGGWM